MNMKDVKAITIPEGTVKKIEDANGNIIWGSQADFPYRRLEYIHFSGSEGCDVSVKPGSSGHQGVMIVTASIETKGGTNYGVVIGCAGDSTSSGAMRILCQTYGNTVGQRVGRNSSTYGYSTTPVSGTIYRFRLRCSSNSSTYINIQNADGTNISGTDHTTSVSYTVNNMPNLQLMRYNSSGSIINNGYTVGNIYKFTKQQTDSASAYLWKCYPVQRKSDGVCGLYNTVNGYFIPMQGTNITDSAAGPVVDEYWDLTAPD